MTRWLVTQEELNSATPGSLEARWVSFVKTHGLPIEPETPWSEEVSARSAPAPSWWRPALAWLLPRMQEGDNRERKE